MVAGSRRSVDATAIARTAASAAPARSSVLSRLTILIGLREGERGSRPGELGADRSIRPIVVLIAVALITILAFGALAVGSGLVRIPSVTPPQPETVSPSVVPSRPAGSTGWAATGNPVEIRFGETATLLPNGDVLVVGGNPEFVRRGSSRATAERFDPTTGRWTPTGAMHEARQEHAAVLLANGEVLVLGGNAAGVDSSRALSSAELYDPRTGSWTETGRMAAARTRPTATLLSDGRVLVTGGVSIGAERPERTAEIYDPVTGRWAKTASMSIARIGHTATRLPDGKVLVAGGGCCDQAARASAERYDPVSGTWAETGTLGSARTNHTAILLADGRVLVYGGDNGNDHPVITTAELYDPAVDEWVATGSPGSSGDRFESQGSSQAEPLSDGKVFAATFGGGGELYDPARGSWTTVGGLAGDTYTYVHTSTLLADGRVLVTTEQFPAAGGGPVPVAAVFDPEGTP